MAQSKEQYMRAVDSQSPETRRAQGSPAFLSFPEDLALSPQQPNYMVFTAMTVSGGVDTRTLRFQLAEGTNSVALPIPPGVNASYQQNWDEQSVGTSASAIATKGAGLMNTIGRISTAGSLTDIAAAAVAAGARGIDQLGQQLQGASIPGAKAAINSAGGGFTNEMTGFMATAPGFNEVVSAAQYGIGKRALDQTMISYGGPTFRSFSWQYSLRPLSMRESETAHQIVNFFKIRSAPEQTAMQFTRVYNLPEVFRIQFFDASGESNYIDKVGHCALTEIQVTYGGDKYTTFRDTHAPIQIDLSLSFKEMELLNRQAVANEDGGLMGWPGDTYGLEPNRLPEPKALPIDSSVPTEPGPK